MVNKCIQGTHLNVYGVIILNHISLIFFYIKPSLLLENVFSLVESFEIVILRGGAMDITNGLEANPGPI